MAVSFGTPAERAHYGRINRNDAFGSTFDLAHYGRLVNTAVIFVDDGAGGKVWFAAAAGTVWDALDGPTVWTSDCEGGIRWIADKSCEETQLELPPQNGD